MIKPKEYHVYRYFVQINEQLSFNAEVIRRVDVLKSLTKILNDNDKIKYEYRNKSYILYPLIRLDGELYICKFSKEKQLKRHHEGNTDIDEDKEPDYPYVYIIIDMQSQMILIQKNTNVFMDTISCKNRLQDLFRKTLGSFTHRLIIESITDKEQFWKTVDSASKVYNFKLKLNAPNLFGAKVKANKFMKEQKESYNLSNLEIKMDNEQGELILTKNNLDDFVEYAAEGGGSYKLRYYDGHDIQILESKNMSKRILLPNELTINDIDLIKNEMDRIDGLRDNNER